MKFQKLIKAEEFDAKKEELRDKAVHDFVNALTGAYLKYKLSGLTEQELSSVLEEAQIRLEDL